MTNAQLKNKIMRQVYATWLWNRSKPVLFLQLPLLIVFLAIQHEYVAFKAVAANTLNSLNSPSSVFNYAVSAFQTAEPLVIFLAAAIGLFAVLALNSIARNIIALSRKEIRLPARIDK
ncbi:MAG: hypothetical protein HYT38_02710 [Candidatus Sungbacteria bacterium]|uniref:Uncharacterized protein n=1 Tax=Candidatus Sungiibacteriota bacterium TaxID=2750080 RepID=A0A9D6DSK9_9BACT|nr:hypothetical protein [Candidatus Sungbacteria bacterium]